MILDFLILAVTISLLTLLTASKDNRLPQLKQNSITSGILLTIIQLMIFISRLNSVETQAPDFYKLVISVLVKFRPLLMGLLFRILFGIIEAVLIKQNTKDNNIADEKKKSPSLDFSFLSRREIEVARLASKGYTNAQIAETLYISTETVKSHMNSIFEKLGITSRKELMER